MNTLLILKLTLICAVMNAPLLLIAIYSKREFLYKCSKIDYAPIILCSAFMFISLCILFLLGVDSTTIFSRTVEGQDIEWIFIKEKLMYTIWLPESLVKSEFYYMDISAWFLVILTLLIFPFGMGLIQFVKDYRSILKKDIEYEYLTSHITRKVLRVVLIVLSLILLIHLEYDFLLYFLSIYLLNYKCVKFTIRPYIEYTINKLSAVYSWWKTLTWIEKIVVFTVISSADRAVFYNFWYWATTFIECIYLLYDGDYEALNEKDYEFGKSLLYSLFVLCLCGSFLPYFNKCIKGSNELKRVTIFILIIFILLNIGYGIHTSYMLYTWDIDTLLKCINRFWLPDDLNPKDLKSETITCIYLLTLSNIINGKICPIIVSYIFFKFSFNESTIFLQNKYIRWFTLLVCVLYNVFIYIRLIEIISAFIL